MTVRTPYRSREQLRAAAILGGLVLGALVLWIVAMTTTGSQTSRPDLFADAEIEAAPSAEDPDPSDGAAADEQGADGGTSNDDANEQGEAGQGEGDEDPGTADDPDGEEEPDPADEEADPADDEADPADDARPVPSTSKVLPRHGSRSSPPCPATTSPRPQPATVWTRARYCCGPRTTRR
jgi:hypothetical protein